MKRFSSSSSSMSPSYPQSGQPMVSSVPGPMFAPHSGQKASTCSHICTSPNEIDGLKRTTSCEDSNKTIEVLSRKGNTHFVLPDGFLNAPARSMRAAGPFGLIATASLARRLRYSERLGRLSRYTRLFFMRPPLVGLNKNWKLKVSAVGHNTRADFPKALALVEPPVREAADFGHTLF